MRHIAALYRASGPDASRKAGIIWHHFKILPGDPGFDALMEMTIDALDDMATPVRTEPFFLMTTSMNFIDRHRRHPHRMTTHWPVIRDNIKRCVEEFGRAVPVRIIHFVVEHPGHVDDTWQMRLGEEDYRVINTGFPRTAAAMASLGIHLTPVNHILVDMANLVRYSQVPSLANGFYANYDSGFVRSINHIYLEYNNFVNGIEPNTGPLIRLEAGHMSKACFDASTLHVDRQALSATGPMEGNCRGRCGLHAQAGSKYCSSCARVKERGGDPRACSVCPNPRQSGHTRCQECIDSDRHPPPTITGYVRATEACSVN